MGNINLNIYSIRLIYKIIFKMRFKENLFKCCRDLKEVSYKGGKKIIVFVLFCLFIFCSLLVVFKMWIL